MKKTSNVISKLIAAFAACALFLTPIAAEGDGDTIDVGSVDEITEAQRKNGSNYQNNTSASGSGVYSGGNTSKGNDDNTGTSDNSSGNNNQTVQQSVSNTYTDPRLNIESQLEGYINTDTDMDEFFDRFIAKEYALMNGFQRAALPWCFGSFILGTLMLIWGAISKRMSIMPGIWTMIVSGIAYTCIIYGPSILNYFSHFLTD